MFCFNGIIACMYGVEEAVFIHNIYWWTRQNKKNGINYRDGRNWTYNSMEALSELFPFWTKRQIERITKKLVEGGALVTANYNEKPFDRTKWYALTEAVISIYANSDMEPRKRGQGDTQTVPPIPDSKPDSKPDIENGGSARAHKDVLQGFDGELRKKLEEWLCYKAERRESYKPTGLRSFISEVQNKRKVHSDTDICALIGQCMANGWKGIIWDKLEKQCPRRPNPRDPARTAGSSIDEDALDAFIDGQFSGEGGT